MEIVETRLLMDDRELKINDTVIKISKLSQ